MKFVDREFMFEFVFEIKKTNLLKCAGEKLVAAERNILASMQTKADLDEAVVAQAGNFCFPDFSCGCPPQKKVSREIELVILSKRFL